MMYFSFNRCRNYFLIAITIIFKFVENANIKISFMSFKLNYDSIKMKYFLNFFNEILCDFILLVRSGRILLLKM